MVDVSVREGSNGASPTELDSIESLVFSTDSWQFCVSPSHGSSSSVACKYRIKLGLSSITPLDSRS